jgi:hypothetical protein
MKVGMYDSRLDGPILPKSVRKSLDTQRTESGPDIPGMMLRPSTGHRSLRSIARRWKVQVTVDELKSRIAASGLACASQGTSPTPRPCPAIGARQSCSRCDSQNYSQLQQRDGMRPLCRLATWQPTRFTTLRRTARLPGPLPPRQAMLPTRTMATEASAAAETGATTGRRSASTRASGARSTLSRLPLLVGFPMPTLTSC